MLSVVVQAGGESRRMGSDKALIPFMGQPLVVRVIKRLSGLGDEMIVVTNKMSDYEFLGMPLVSDFYPGRGALGGLFTALKASNHPDVVVAACDMPFVSRSLLTHQIAVLQNTGCDAVMPKTSFGVEPFHAVYKRSTCLPLIKTALEAGAWRVDSWFKDANIRFLSQDETRDYDPLQIAFNNLNTPEDVKEAEELAKKLDNLDEETK
jgi:molybdopterin-guanine dinucleotide biosynthesis protein A